MATSTPSKYEVRWRVAGTSQWGAVHPIAPTDDIVVKGLDNDTGKTYEFQVRAVSSCGAKSAWVGSNYQPGGVQAPPAAESLTAQSLADGVHLAWTFSGQWVGVKFSIERSTSATTGFAERTQVLGTSHTDPETTGTTYYYRVRAISDMGGPGEYSNVTSSKGVSMDLLADDVAAAQEAADNAAQEAAAANTILGDFADDNILSSPEKPIIVRNYGVITEEQAGIDAQAVAYGVTAEKTAYDNKISALTVYLNSLTTPTAWNDKSGNTDIVGLTFTAKFKDVYAARQALLNAIYAAAKAKSASAQAAADAAQNAANRALAALTIPNPTFSDGLTGWESFSSLGSIASGEFYPETGDHGFPNQGTYLVHAGQAGQTWAGVRTHAMQVAPGENVTVYLEVKDAGAAVNTGMGTPSANTSASAVACLFWYDHTGAKIGNTVKGSPAAGPGGDYLQCVSKVSDVAPAGAFTVKAGVQFDSHTSGSMCATNFRIQTQPASLDDIPDSSTRYAAAEAGAVKSWGKVYDDGGKPENYSNVTQSYASASDNMLPNPGFESHVTGAPNGVDVASGGAVCDGWSVHQKSSGLQIYWYTGAGRQGGHGLFLRAAQGSVLTGTGYAEARVISAPLQVSVGDVLSFGGWVQTQALSDVDSLARLSLFKIDDSGAESEVANHDFRGTSSWALQSPYHYTVPSGVVAVRMQCAFFARPSNGTTIAVSGDAHASFDDMYVTRNDLRAAGSGIQLGSIENQQTFGWASFGSAWTSGVLSYSATSTNAVITASAGTLGAGVTAISYNASSMNMAGAPGQHRDEYFYYNDAPPLGGSHPIRGAYDTVLNFPASNNIVYIGTLNVVYPTSGTGSGGGGGSGGGNRPCVSVDSFVLIRRGNTCGPMRAGLVKNGDEILCCIPQTGRTWWERITQAHTAFVRGVTVRTALGVRLTCSHDAAIADLDGRKIPAETLRGIGLPSWDGAGHHLDHVDDVTDTGIIEVMKISSGNNWFLAGDIPGHYIAHHNQKRDPGGF